MADDDSTTGGGSETDPDAGQQGKPEAPPEVKRALAKANKEAETLRLKLKEFEDRDKSELQRTVEARDAAVREATEAKSVAERYRVAVAKGFPAELADRLRGQTAEELEADADKLLALIAGAGNGKPPSFDSGARGGGDKPGDMNSLIRKQAGY